MPMAWSHFKDNYLLVLGENGPAPVPAACACLISEYRLWWESEGAVAWVFEAPLKLDIEALITSVMVFGGGLWEIIRHEGSKE